MKKTSIYILLFLSFTGFAQETVSLQECYALVYKNYPLAKQQHLLATQNELNTAVLKTGYKPKINAAAQATYQSDVIQIPIPNTSIEPLNKDQYKATLTLNQLLYNGGLIDATIKEKASELKAAQKQVEVNLYQLKKQVNQLYFSIVLAQDKKALVIAKQKLLRTKLHEIQSGIKNGVLLPASDKVIAAELLKATQQIQEIDANKQVLVNRLSVLIGETIAATNTFKSPKLIGNFDTEIKRPELELFQLKKEQLEATEKTLSKQNAPKVFGFATGGYGNPGLNMLDNSFQSFYIVGLKLNWNVFDWNANKKKRKALLINKDIINTQTEVFKLHTNTELQQLQTEFYKLEAFIKSDLEIIKLRKEVLKSVESQLKNGVVTTSAYLTELTNLFEDQTNLSTHQTQLVLTKANYNVTKGQ